MPLTKEQIELQRVKFEKNYKIPLCAEFQLNIGVYVATGNYLNSGHLLLVSNINDRFQVWLSAIESVEIELPSFQIMDDPDGEGRGEYVMREVLEAKLEKQGYKVKP